MQAVYDSWDRYQLGTPLRLVLEEMKQRITNATLPHSNGGQCGRVKNMQFILTARLEDTVTKLEG